MIAIHSKELMQNWSKGKVSKPIVYKSIMLPAELQESIKVEAILRKLTIIEYIKYLRENQPLTDYKKLKKNL